MTGTLLKWLINRWLSVMGKVCRFSDYPWLDGFIAHNEEIGVDYYTQFARSMAYQVVDTEAGGLLSDFNTVLSAEGRPVKSACCTLL